MMSGIPFRFSAPRPDGNEPEYGEGTCAFLEGLTLKDNPYPGSGATTNKEFVAEDHQSMAWYSGYLDAGELAPYVERLRKRLAELNLSGEAEWTPN